MLLQERDDPEIRSSAARIEYDGNVLGQWFSRLELTNFRQATNHRDVGETVTGVFSFCHLGLGVVERDDQEGVHVARM